MCRRLDGGPIPKRYFNCLLNLEKTTFQFIEYPDSKMTDKDDHSFLSIIPSLKTKTDFSNLKQMAGERAKNPGLMPCAIYNKDTYLEFYRLLCDGVCARAHPNPIIILSYPYLIYIYILSHHLIFYLIVALVHSRVCIMTNHPLVRNHRVISSDLPYPASCSVTSVAP